MPIELESLRDLATALPMVVEGTWYGSPAFRVGGRVFARVHENDPDLFLIKVGPLERDYLVESAPGRFLRTEHRSEAEDSVLMRLSTTTDDQIAEIAELLDTAWERIAPPKVRRDAGRAS